MRCRIIMSMLTGAILAVSLFLGADPATCGAGDRLRSVLTLGDQAAVTETRGGRRTAWSWLDDTYSGDAAYTADVPRDQRHAVGTTSERYRSYGSDGC